MINHIVLRMKRVILLLMTVLLLTSLASAEIIFKEQPKELYSLGEIINVPVKVATTIGIEPLKQLPKVFEDNLLFRRKIIFAHRDIQRIFLAIKDKKPFVMMTGLMPLENSILDI